MSRGENGPLGHIFPNNVYPGSICKQCGEPYEAHLPDPVVVPDGSCLFAQDFLGDEVECMECGEPMSIHTYRAPTFYEYANEVGIGRVDIAPITAGDRGTKLRKARRG